MGRSRTLVSFVVAALLVTAGLVALRMRTAGESSPQLPAVAQAAGERGPGSELARTDALAERQAVAEGLATLAAPAPDPKSAARLTVELVAAGRPSAGGTVEIRSESDALPRAADVDPANGCARFDRLPPGTYTISLPKCPPGFLPPRAFQRRGGSDDEQKRVALAGEDRTLRFELEAAVHVSGFVSTPDGRLAKSVRLQWGSSLGYSLRTRFTRPAGTWERHVDPRYFDVVDGRFEGDIVEGLWVVTVEGEALTNDSNAYAAFAPPEPVLRLLPPGSSTQIDLEFQPVGTRRLHGRIQDEEGQPFGGLRVGIEGLHALIEPSTGEALTWPHGGGTAVSSESDGSFSIPGLSAGRFQLFVEPEGFQPMSPPGAGRVGEVVEYRKLELADPVTELELTIRRPHPVHVTGSVAVESGWAQSHSTNTLLPEIEIVWATGRADVPESRRQISYAYGRAEFEFWVEASVREPRLELLLAGEKLVHPLVLSKSGDPAPLTIRFPR